MVDEQKIDENRIDEQKTAEECKDLCKDCSECCGYVVVELPTPQTEKEYDEIAWFLVHENVSVYIDFEGVWNIEFRTPCRYITKEGLCGIYEKRPDLCRRYTHKACEKYNHNPYYYVLLKTRDDLLKYLEESGIKF